MITVLLKVWGKKTWKVNRLLHWHENSFNVHIKACVSERVCVCVCVTLDLGDTPYCACPVLWTHCSIGALYYQDATILWKSQCKWVWCADMTRTGSTLTCTPINSHAHFLVYYLDVKTNVFVTLLMTLLCFFCFSVYMLRTLKKDRVDCNGCTVI